jgi:hypothetical protein
MEGGEVKLAPPSTPELLDAYDDHTYVRDAYVKEEGGGGQEGGIHVYVDLNCGCDMYIDTYMYSKRGNVCVLLRM